MKIVTADLLLILVTFFWGSTFVVVQQTIQSITPMAFLAYRFFIAAFLIFIFIYFRNRTLFLNRKALIHGFLLGILLFGGYAAQTVGLLFTVPSISAFITGMSVVIVPVFIFLFSRKRPPRLVIAGIIVSFSGLYLLTAQGASPFNLGSLLTLLCAVFFSLHIIMTDHVTKHSDGLILTFAQLLTVSMLSLIFSFIFDGRRALLQLSILKQPSVLYAILFTAVFATAFAYILQTYCQRFTTPSHVGLIFIFEPVFAFFTSWFWEGDSLSFTGIIGSLLILLGMGLAEWHPSKKQQII